MLGYTIRSSQQGLRPAVELARVLEIMHGDTGTGNEERQD